MCLKDKLFEVAYLTVITLIAIFILACCTGIVIDRINPPQPVVVYQTVDTTIPTPTITPFYPEYITPFLITYTVRSTDPTNLKVVTTEGEVLYFKSRNAWSQQVKKCTYTARVESTNGYSYVIRGYPKLEEVYLPPDNGHGRGEYIEV